VLVVPDAATTPPTTNGTGPERAEIERMMNSLREQAETLRAEMRRLKEQIQSLPRNDAR